MKSGLSHDSVEVSEYDFLLGILRDAFSRRQNGRSLPPNQKVFAACIIVNFHTTVHDFLRLALQLLTIKLTYPICFA